MTIEPYSEPRFVAEPEVEAPGWPWVRQAEGLWRVVDVARDVVIRCGMEERRALEQARFCYPYAPAIRGRNVNGQPVGVSGGYVVEVWAWNQAARWDDGTSSAWALEALCDAPATARVVGMALLEHTRAQQSGATAVEVWAATGMLATWQCLERLELDTLDGEVVAETDATCYGKPGPVMPWHEVGPNGSVPSSHVSPSAARDVR